MTLIAAVLDLGNRETRALDLQRLAQHRYQELVLVGIPYLAGVGQTEAAHRQGRVFARQFHRVNVVRPNNGHVRMDNWLAHVRLAFQSRNAMLSKRIPYRSSSSPTRGPAYVGIQRASNNR